jgi:RNA polymerase-binding transcription factor DksA
MTALHAPATEIDLLRDRLETQRSFRREQLTQLRRHLRHDRLNATEREIATSLLIGARRALRAVDAALYRMDHGGFGLCRDCGARLSPERVQTLPQVTLCQQCQHALDVS